MLTSFEYEAPNCIAEASAASRILLSQVAGGSEFRISISTAIPLSRKSIELHGVYQNGIALMVMPVFGQEYQIWLTIC